LPLDPLVLHFAPSPVLRFFGPRRNVHLLQLPTQTGTLRWEHLDDAEKDRCIGAISDAYQLGSAVTSVMSMTRFTASCLCLRLCAVAVTDEAIRLQAAGFV
jgi:hypothetical protein